MPTPVVSKELVQRFSQELLPQLSPDCSVSIKRPSRWSTFNEPEPAVVVNIGNEEDVALTVRFCNELKVPFLAQNGGIGWAQTFDLGKQGVIINLKNLKTVDVNDDKHSMTIGGGVTVKETINAAADAGVLVVTGNCNCVGALGAYLGGGYGYLTGIYGLGVDNVISMRVVTAEGQLITVNASSHPNLFFALRGAGPNFGIVTSAVIKAYPASEEEHRAWGGALIFTPDKLEQLVEAVDQIELKPDRNIFMYFASSGPPNNAPVVIISVFLHKGTPESGREAFASIYSIGDGPVMEMTAIQPYKLWNAGADNFCVKGGRKPSFSVGLQKLYPKIWRQVWDQYVEFQKTPGAENTLVLLEKYDPTKARSIGDTAPAAFAHRHIGMHAIVIAWYEDPALDVKAVEFGRSVRALWNSKTGLDCNSTHVNFAHGDEELATIYGDNLPRLQVLKKQLDPANRFNQWFNIV